MSETWPRPLEKRVPSEVPFGSGAKVCTVSLGKIAKPAVNRGDVVILRVDMSHLLEKGNLDLDAKRRLLERVGDPNHYFKAAAFSSPEMKVLSERSRIHGTNNDKLEYLFFAKADASGKTEFTTNRYYQVVTGQREIGVDELEVLRVYREYRKILFKEGNSTPLLSELLGARLTAPSLNAKNHLRRLEDEERGKSWEERLALADERIEKWRKAYTASPIYSGFTVSGNILPFSLQTAGKRENVEVNHIHQLRYDERPQRLTVSKGDIIVIETLRPSETEDRYRYKFDIPIVRGNGLRHLFTETTEQALLPSDYGINRAKTYFWVESDSPASIEVSKPRLNRTLSENEQTEWVRKIDIRVKPSLPDLVEPAVAPKELRVNVSGIKPPTTPSVRDEGTPELPPNSVLSASDVKAIDEFLYVTNWGGTPTFMQYQDLSQVLQPFFGESKGEREFFLKRAGLSPIRINFLMSLIDFDSPSKEFLPKIINVLLPDRNLIRVSNHLKALRLNE